MPRIAVARLWFEGSSFTPVPTGIEAFRAREWVVGAAREGATRRFTLCARRAALDLGALPFRHLPAGVLDK